MGENVPMVALPNIGYMLPCGDGPLIGKTGENEKKEEGLGQTLTKSQITALAALSITDVNLLRQHLERDDDARFYKLILSLILIALILQIIGAVITIMVTHCRSYYQKHRAERSVDDVCKMYCGCKLRKDSSIVNRERCCICFTCRIHDPYEYAAIEDYEKWCSDAVRKERETSETREALQSIESSIDNTDERLDLLKRQQDDHEVDEEEYKAKHQQLVAEKSAAMDRKHVCLQDREKAATFLRDGEILHSRVSDIYKNRTMEKATFWLNAVNYILFAVAILHTLILGLGVFTLKDDSGSGTTASP